MPPSQEEDTEEDYIEVRTDREKVGPVLAATGQTCWSIDCVPCASAKPVCDRVDFHVYSHQAMADNG